MPADDGRTGGDDDESDREDECADAHADPDGLHVPGCVLQAWRFLRDGGAFAGHEQTLRVHAVRGAGQQGGEVSPLLDAHEAGVGRVGGGDADHLVGDGPARDGQVEHVASAHLIQTGEQLLVGHAPVGGDDGVRVSAADGQACAVQVAGPVG